MRGTDETQYPLCIHPHESLTLPRKLFSTEENLIYISAQDPVVCSFVSFSPHHFHAGRIAGYSHQTKAVVTGVTSEFVGQVLTLSLLQKQHYHAHHINLQIISLFSIFSFSPISLSTCLTSVCTKLTAKTFSFQCSELGSSGDRLEINNKTTI